MRHNDDSFIDFLLEFRHSDYLFLSGECRDLSTLESINNLHSLLIIRHLILIGIEIFLLYNFLNSLNLWHQFCFSRFNSNYLINSDLFLNSILLVGRHSYYLINSFSNNFVFSSDNDSIIVQFNNAIHFNWNIVFDIDDSVLADFNYDFNGFLDESVYDYWLNEWLFGWKHHWYLHLLDDWSELFIYYNLSFSVNLRLDDSHCLLNHFLNLHYLGLDDLFSDWHLNRDMDLFMLNYS